MASRIPAFGSWKDGDSNGNGFTTEFQKARTFKKAGSIITRNDLNRIEETPINQDFGPTPTPETTPPTAKARPDSEARKASDGGPSKGNKGKRIRPRRKSPPELSPPIPVFGEFNSTQDLTDIFRQNGRGRVEPNHTPPTPEQHKARKKGGCWKWLCGCCFVRRKRFRPSEARRLS